MTLRWLAINNTLPILDTKHSTLHICVDSMRIAEV